MKKTSLICLIPARGGSKRIPRKNIVPFHGKPLIAWSIESALQSKIFDDVIVSTDDQEIAKISKSYGATVPFLRPDNLSNDTAIDADVRKHFLDWSETQKRPVDSLCYLYPTVPFFGAPLIRQCHQIFINSDATSIKTIVKHRFPILQSCERDKHGFLTYKWGDYLKIRTQEMPDFFIDAGVCYFFNYSDEVRRGELGFEIPNILAHDIDTPEDLHLAKKIFKWLTSEGWAPDLSDCNNFHLQHEV